MARGPQSSIVIPGGAITIPAGNSIQTAIDANPAGTSFGLGVGVHSITAPIIPKGGNSFTGAFGAIVDGTGWSSSNLDDAAFKALNLDVDDVTLRNIEIRNMPQKGIMAYRDFSNRWTVDHCDVHHNKNGVELPGGSILSNSKLHHNVGTPNHANPAERGGGYSFNAITGLQLLNNEINDNGTEQKWILCRDILCAGNWFHHNAFGGPWIDGGGTNSVIEDNLCEDDIGPGIIVEIASGVIVRRNTCRRNGITIPAETHGGILISVSQGCTVLENTLENNAFGMDLFLDCQRLAEHYSPFPDPDLANNVFRGNTVLVGSGQLAAIFTYINAGCEAPYLALTKNIRFEENRYTVPVPDGAYWVWGNGQNKTFLQWQALGFDTYTEPIPPVPAPGGTCILNSTTYPEGTTVEVVVKKNKVGAWQAANPDWTIVSQRIKNRTQVILVVECNP